MFEISLSRKDCFCAKLLFVFKGVLGLEFDLKCQARKVPLEVFRNLTFTSKEAKVQTEETCLESFILVISGDFIL